jgi:predicted phage tail protein
MQTVHLKGDMGNRFGEKWSMNVSNAQDIFKLIECQREGFKQYMLDCVENGVDFTVQRGEEFIEETELMLSLGKEDITVTAIPAGSKGNVGKLIAAALLIYTGYWMYQGAALGTGTAAAGGIVAPATKLGTNALHIGFNLGKAGKMLGYTAMALGTSLGLRTIGEMMLPDAKDPEDDSHLFGGPLNTTTQGGAVPVLYGEMMVGGHVINSSYTSSMANSWNSGMPGRDNPLGIDVGIDDLNAL